MPLTKAEQAFYEWYHNHEIRAVSIELQREIFLAGYEAAVTRND